MFLALTFYARLPLVTALAASKLANTCSATVALISYGSRGYIHWMEGLSLGLGAIAGAYLGAHLASKNAARLVRPMLVCVVALLFFKLLRG